MCVVLFATFSHPKMMEKALNADFDIMTDRYKERVQK